MRHFAIFSSVIGLLLCLGAAVTGVYWGVFLIHKGVTPIAITTEEWRKVHLNLAIACVFVSMVAHALSIHILRKSKG
jgi:hypothetical protein